MNDIVDGLADNYNISQQEGRKEISRSWKRLRPDTRAWLTSSGRCKAAQSSMPRVTRPRWKSLNTILD